jgi:parallel beta-helix repeat protein
MRQIYPLMAPLALALPLLTANPVHANPAGNKLAIPSPPPTPRTASPNPTTTQPTQATTNAVPANPKPAQATANTTPANAKPAPVTTAPLPTAATLKVEMPTPTPTPVNVQQVLYVNPVTGQDTYNGQTPQTAFRTITQALKFAEGGTLIQLAPGRYTAESGEQFPLKLKPGVILRGNEATRGEDVVIEGGGRFVSRIFARQNATILAGETSHILGVTVTNRHVRGTAIWVESTNPYIRNCTFINNHREGIFVTGEGAPRIEDNLFMHNGGNGVSLTKAAKGEVRRNVFVQTGFGLAIGGVSAPIVADNRIENNVDGVVISDVARPILRGNRIAFNRRTGIIVISSAEPDLGTLASPGNNTFHNNGNHDLHNATKNVTLVSVGNRLDVTKVNGQVQVQ